MNIEICIDHNETHYELCPTKPTLIFTNPKSYTYIIQKYRPRTIYAHTPKSIIRNSDNLIINKYEGYDAFIIILKQIIARTSKEHNINYVRKSIVLYLKKFDNTIECKYEDEEIKENGEMYFNEFCKSLSTLKNIIKIKNYDILSLAITVLKMKDSLSISELAKHARIFYLHEY
jgi:hypothetical protein